MRGAAHGPSAKRLAADVVAVERAVERYPVDCIVRSLDGGLEVRSDGSHVEHAAASVVTCRPSSTFVPAW